MDLQYKRISSIEGTSPKPIGNVGIRLELAINRDLSEGELSYIRREVSNILRFVNKNTIANDPATIQAIKEEKESLIAAFGDRAFYIKEIPNEYSSEDASPWYIITTTKGPIKVGWRKRVIEIGWENDVNSLSATELFPEEKVTRSTKYDYPHYIHAWGYEKVKEYLDIILK